MITITLFIIAIIILVVMIVSLAIQPVLVFDIYCAKRLDKYEVMYQPGNKPAWHKKELGWSRSYLHNKRGQIGFSIEGRFKLYIMLWTL